MHILNLNNIFILLKEHYYNPRIPLQSIQSQNLNSKTRSSQSGIRLKFKSLPTKQTSHVKRRLDFISFRFLHNSQFLSCPSLPSTRPIPGTRTFFDRCYFTLPCTKLRVLFGDKVQPERVLPEARHPSKNPSSPTQLSDQSTLCPVSSQPSSSQHHFQPHLSQEILFFNPLQVQGRSQVTYQLSLLSHHNPPPAPPPFSNSIPPAGQFS